MAFFWLPVEVHPYFEMELLCCCLWIEFQMEENLLQMEYLAVVQMTLLVSLNYASSSSSLTEKNGYLFF